MRMLRFACLCGLFVSLALAAGCGGSGAQAPRIKAGGATFIDPIMQKWSGAYRSAKNVEIDYVKSGSTNGIVQMTDKSIDFGCSDAPMKKDQVAKAKEAGGDVVHVPLVVGAVAVVYNVPGLTAPLKLTGDVLADIYRKDPSVAKWNAAAIAALNPGVALPDKDIVVVGRAESSGTSFIFSDYLAKVSEKFKSEVGASTQPKWSKGVGGQQGNDGVASFVKINEGAIGYVELTFAKKNGLAIALMKNKAGDFVGPDGDGPSAAAAEAMLSKPTQEPYSLHELTYSLTDMPGAKSYPISGLSFGLLYAKQPKDKGPVIVEFLKWAITDGQAFAKDLDYAPLPADLQKKAVERLGTVKFE